MAALVLYSLAAVSLYQCRVPALRVAVPRVLLPPRCAYNPPLADSPDLGAPAAEGFPSAVSPIKTMIFIDGSWLYYSFHGRRSNCPVTAQYGAGWEYGHSLDFDRLPQLVSQYISAELLKRFGTQRFVEVVRTVVFTSARADTHPESTRMRSTCS